MGKTKWISVNKQLPKKMTDVLLANKTEDWIAMGYRNILGKFHISFLGPEVFEITHWMPLPKKP